MDKFNKSILSYLESTGRTRDDSECRKYGVYMIDTQYIENFGISVPKFSYNVVLENKGGIIEECKEFLYGV